jgi:isoquinoline 1-oxidoreductase beta subunit
MTGPDLSRRAFLRRGVGGAAGLTIAFHLPGCVASEEAAPTEGEAPFLPNAWLRIGGDGTTTVVLAKSEMGQGVMTALPQILVDELDGDWSSLRIEEAAAGPEYGHPWLGPQVTAASSSVRSSMQPLREAGAKARAMLIAAAAQQWAIHPSACHAENGFVIETEGTRRAGYGALAEAASRLPEPDVVLLKELGDFRLVGRSVPRLDIPEKVTGRARYGIDVDVPDMLVAVVARCPTFGGSAKDFDDGPALRVPGVKTVVPISSGVAVVADGSWAALQGRKALRVTWDKGDLAGLDSETIAADLVAMARESAVTARDDGDVTGAMARAATTLHAEYRQPYLAHAAMEPPNCTALVTDDACTVWAPTQAQGKSRRVAAEITGLPETAVQVHTTFLGGGFGRGLEADMVREAVELSRDLRVPVKVLWSREDDLAHDFYRPPSYHRLSAGLDASGSPVAWTHHVACPSLLGRDRPLADDELDRTSVAGAADMPYDIPNVRCDWTRVEPGVPIGWWRSVGHLPNVFAVECFIDELASLTGADPYQFRRVHLRRSGRHRAALDVAAAESGWGKSLPRGRARGIAVGEAFGSFVAQVAEVSVELGRVRVHRVTCAIDCGMVVNPEIVTQQMEGGIVYGLTAALHGRIDIVDGAVKQQHFDDYRLLRMSEMPEVEVHILPSAEPPGGVGEVGVPTVAPAVVNAVAVLTGRRLRSLPLVL